MDMTFWLPQRQRWRWRRWKGADHETRSLASSCDCSPNSGLSLAVSLDPLVSADGAEDLATMDTLALGDTDMNIFVGNLAFATTEQDLRQLFEPYGTVDTIRMMTDRDTGRSRGFGFVEMPAATRHRTRLPACTARPWPGALSRSTKPGRGNRAVSRASPAGSQPSTSPNSSPGHHRYRDAVRVPWGADERGSGTTFTRRSRACRQVRSDARPYRNATRLGSRCCPPAIPRSGAYSTPRCDPRSMGRRSGRLVLCQEERSASTRLSWAKDMGAERA